MDSERPPRVLWAILALTVVVGVGMAAPVSLPSDNAMFSDTDGSAAQTATPTESAAANDSGTPAESVTTSDSKRGTDSGTVGDSATPTVSATAADTKTPESVTVGDSETFVVEPTGDEGSFEYRFTVDGEVSPAETDAGALEASDRIVPHDNGTVTVVGVADAPAGDAFDVDGRLLDFDRPATQSADQSADQSDVKLSVDDTDVTVTVIQNVEVEQPDSVTSGGSPAPDRPEQDNDEEEAENDDGAAENDGGVAENDDEAADNDARAADNDAGGADNDAGGADNDAGGADNDAGGADNDGFDTARPIEPGTYEQVEAGDDERDYYAIDIDEGEVINVWLLDSQSAANLRVYGPDREFLEGMSLSNGDDWISTSPLPAGTYYLEAAKAVGPGTYSFGLSTTPDDDRFEPNNDPDTATAITPGRYENLRITDGEADTFVVDAEEGQRVRIEIEFDHDTGNLDIAHYFDSDYIGSFSETDGETFTRRVPRSGPFEFEIVGTDGATAPYSLEVTIVGEDSPTATDTETATATPTATDTRTKTATATPTTTDTRTKTAKATPTATDTQTKTATETQTRTTSETRTQTATATRTTTARTTVSTTEPPTGTEAVTSQATAAGTTSTSGD